ncbi:hypothetical protein K9M74_04685 [Candidatus Woesearchaeota archaeon]|nr:hypothetical protein [Candidatus Woesearchaeota archaeon]
MKEWYVKNVFGESESESDFLSLSMQDDIFVENLLYNDELSFEEAAFLSGYYADVQESFS